MSLFLNRATNGDFPSSFRFPAAFQQWHRWLVTWRVLHPCLHLCYCRYHLMMRNETLDRFQQDMQRMRTVNSSMLSGSNSVYVCRAPPYPPPSLLSRVKTDFPGRCADADAFRDEKREPQKAITESYHIPSTSMTLPPEGDPNSSPHPPIACTPFRVIGIEFSHHHSQRPV